MRLINKNGDIIKIKPRMNYKSFRHSYYFKIYEWEGYVKALNETMALFKFCLRHPLILFRLEG